MFSLSSSTTGLPKELQRLLFLTFKVLLLPPSHHGGVERAVTALTRMFTCAELKASELGSIHEVTGCEKTLLVRPCRKSTVHKRGGKERAPPIMDMHSDGKSS